MRGYGNNSAKATQSNLLLDTNTQGVRIIAVPMKLPDEIREYFRKQGATGGKTRAENLTAEQRSELARKAVNARWAKAKKSAKPKQTKRTRGEK